MGFLSDTDPQVAEIIQAEQRRQADTLELIASENHTSPAVLEANASVLTDKYAEGYPYKRWYRGCHNADAVEQLAIDRVKELFGADHANVQPHSGANANMCVYQALLEPVVNVEITVPSQFMGDISGDLNSRRGRIQGMEASADMQTIQAKVPMSEVMQYATELRSMTGGTASYTMEFSRYDPVPARQTEGIIAKAKQAKEDANK